jgi:hypothetical protein
MNTETRLSSTVLRELEKPLQHMHWLLTRDGKWSNSTLRTSGLLMLSNDSLGEQHKTQLWKHPWQGIHHRNSWSFLMKQIIFIISLTAEVHRL